MSDYLEISRWKFSNQIVSFAEMLQHRYSASVLCVTLDSSMSYPALPDTSLSEISGLLYERNAAEHLLIAMLDQALL